MYCSTLQSPQILELSGIGDPAILDPLGITVELDLPAVGTNVQDHIVAGALYSKLPRFRVLGRAEAQYAFG